MLENNLNRVLVFLCDLCVLCGLLLIVFSVSQARAGEAVPTENDPVAATRAAHLANELRCLVCQNQSIAESNAELAVDLRRQIREQIAAGKSDGEILTFMVARYGDFVLYRPPLRATTILLWLGPLLLLVAGSVVLARHLRARRRREEPALTPEERERAERLLARGPGTQP